LGKSGRTVGGPSGPERETIAQSPREVHLQRLVEAGMFLNQELSLESLLTRLVHVAGQLLEARYVALGVLTDDGKALKSFITSGISESEKAAIGPYPTGKGLLGVILTAGRPLRIPDLARDSRSVGFPANHPPMASFLGVPILWRGKVFGRLYCTEKRDAVQFTAEDEELASLLAAQAGLAIENANLYQEARKAIQEREDVVAVVSHDLKNPLTAIKMNTFRLLRQLPADAAWDGARSQVAIIEAAADRMIRLIRDLLDLGRIQSGQLTVTPCLVSLMPLMLEVLTAMRPLADEKSLTLAETLPDGFPDIFADRGRCLQVLSNLIDNAIKFTPPNGTVSVSVTLHAEGPLFCVRDSGPGIPASDQPHIFDRYWQAKETARMGTGLGLAIAKGIVEAHGGRIWVESADGSGSAFFFTLPSLTMAETSDAGECRTW
jgi:signal transduction histidine kinase